MKCNKDTIKILVPTHLVDKFEISLEINNIKIDSAVYAGPVGTIYELSVSDFQNGITHGILWALKNWQM